MNSVAVPVSRVGKHWAAEKVGHFTASTPMWRANLASLITRRSVYTLDLLGEAGMSVQHKVIAGALNGEFPARTSDATHQFLDDIDGGARGAHSS